MEKTFNYSGLFDQALSKIKAIRAPHADRLEEKNLHWDIVKEQVLFDFGDEDFKKSVRVFDGAKEISISCFQFIVEQLLIRYGFDTDTIPVESLRPSLAECKMFSPKEAKEGEIKDKIENAFTGIKFAIKDCKDNKLLLFKEVEESNLWKIKDQEPEPIQAALDKMGCKSCVYIYLMFDYAYYQLVSYNDNQDDPGRGYNLYSLKWFFESYFGSEEYIRFTQAVKDYIEAVNTHVGYTTLKSLTPGSLINFRKNVEGALLHFPYENLKTINQKQFELRDSEYDKLKRRFVDDRYFLTLLGNHDFAESLITAEWLFDSIKKAKAIDLTVIGMGYFKAVEQLLFELICKYKNKDFYIRNVLLDNHNIKEKIIDLSLGAMATFVRNYLDKVFRYDITYPTKKYVREALFGYADLRNGFFHKDNIKSMEKILEIRDTTYQTFFLLLGTFDLSNDDLTGLGFPSECLSDYHKLCEYINYHSDKIFFLDMGYEEEIIVISCVDVYSRTADDRYIQYSGIYFRPFGPGIKGFQGILRFDEQHLPKTIYLGKLEFKRSEQISFQPIKVRKVFENGIFIGPTIAEETEIVY